MSIYRTHANDNNIKENWKKLRFEHGGDWHLYGVIQMTCFGPIGIFGDGEFHYLDPEIAEWRARV